MRGLDLLFWLLRCRDRCLLNCCRQSGGQREVPVLKMMLALLKCLLLLCQLVECWLLESCLLEG